MLPFAQHFTEEWAAAWNSRDLERILGQCNERGQAVAEVLTFRGGV